MVKNSYLLSAGNAALEERCEDFATLSKNLDDLIAAADKRTASRAAVLKSRLECYAAKVILVGQVKAGKSALTNIIAGSPGLLPSDVNPWTSVVTTIRINGKKPDQDEEAPVKAKFTFFDSDDWDFLTTGGGRLGELADRAGASEETLDIEKQIQEMREKTRRRLGKHFEMLLGQSHDYGYVDTELMERYVSLGDGDYSDDVSAKTGRFADITKSAELYLDVPEYAMPMELCDTPGVNDTFMMREQITIRSLRGAELCVVVLAAHQALTTVDLALMRIIATLEKRQIVLFVNRVDELEDPTGQIDEIRDSIRNTLEANKVASDVPVVFGSAMWAEAALTGNVDDLPADAAASLEKYRENLNVSDDTSEEDLLWEASGLPELLTVLGERIADGSARQCHGRILSGTRNLTNTARAVATSRSSGEPATQSIDLNGQEPSDVISTIASSRGAEVGKLCESLRGDLMARMERAQDGFVKRATDSLISHFEEFGEKGTWTYDPAGLRMLHRSAYFSFARGIKNQMGQLFTDVASEVEAVYRAVLGDQLTDFHIEAPEPPQVPPPVGLGKTLALDLQGSWWRRWWQKRRGFEASANAYTHLIRAETQSIIADVERDQVSNVLEECRSIYNVFMHEHIETMNRLSRQDSEAVEVETAVDKPSSETADVYHEILRHLHKQTA